MDEQNAARLHLRNRDIIDAVLARAEHLCPDTLDLLAVTGSFAYGDFREDSDLDLLIVLRDGAEDRLSQCFLMGNSAHDLYTRRWADLERTAAFADPFGGKLLDGQIVWESGDSAEKRFAALRKKLTERLAAPLSAEDRSNAFRVLSDAAGAYGRMCLAENYGTCRMWGGVLWQILAEGIYLINHACVRRGIAGMPAEMASFARLPADFAALTEQLIAAADRDELCRIAACLWHNTEALISLAPAAPLPVGTFEEAVSNWRGKITHAARTDDAFLSFVSAAFCGYYYEEMEQAYGVPCCLPYADKVHETPAEAERSFADALTAYEEICRLRGREPVRYADTDDLMRRYGRGEE